MPKPGQQQGRSDMGTKERHQKTMEATSQSQGNGGHQGGRIGKRRKSPVSNGLRDRTKPKPIEIWNLYVALNNTEALKNENDHIMVTIRLHGTTRQITINALIDSGATEDFIDKGFSSKYNIRTTQATTIREVYLADGQPSAMGPITHTAKVPMDIGSHRELAIFYVAKLPNHEVILGMPWLKQHSPGIDWGQGKITFESERCTTWCLKESPTVYAIPEDEAREENLKVEFGATQSKKDQRIQVRLLDPQAKLQTRGSAKAAGHDLYANEERIIPARRQDVVTTGISITPPRGTYGWIAPRSGMAVKHQIAVNAGVIESDYTGEIKVVLANMGDQDYQIRKGDRIAQLMIERIVESDCYQVPKLGETKRGHRGSGSTGTSKSQICEISARAFGKFYQRLDTTRGILKYNKKEGRISLESVNISTELAIKSGKYPKKRKLEEIVPLEYHGYLDVFEAEEKTELTPHRPGVDVEIKLEEGQGLPV